VTFVTDFLLVVLFVAGFFCAPPSFCAKELFDELCLATFPPLLPNIMRHNLASKHIICSLFDQWVASSSQASLTPNGRFQSDVAAVRVTCGRVVVVLKQHSSVPWS
jgi:hypothetical protein